MSPISSAYRWVLCLAGAVLLMGPAAAAVELPAEAPKATIHDQAVHEIIDADTVRLASGKEVRFVGIQTPKLPLGRVGFRTWPLAEEARNELVELIGSNGVSLHFGGRKEDRYRRYLAHLTLPDGTWLQGELLARGYARVYSFADNRALIAEMLDLERQARAARRGIWSLPFYRIRNPSETFDDIDSFQLVEGRVVKATRVGNTVYLNFGDNWRTDFTFTISGRALTLFERAGIDPGNLTGARVRGRGWIKPVNGTLIDITHPEQLELLGE